MNCPAFFKHYCENFSGTQLSRRVCLLLFVCTLIPVTQSFGQGGPVGLIELKSMIKTYSFSDLNTEIQERGVSFVLTDGVKAQLKNEIKDDDLRKKDYEGFQRLLDVIKKAEPKELVVAVAGFKGGNQGDEWELRLAIERRLKELGAPKNLLRIQPISLSAIPINPEEAYHAGNESGVHLIVWGDWSKSTRETIFHPRIRVIQDAEKTPIKKGTREERYYKLDLAQGSTFDIIESGAVKTSNLIAVLIALSYYKTADYENATQVFKTIPESDAEVFFYLGNCSLYSGREEEAERYFKKALEFDRISLEALTNLGMAQYLTGRYQEAIESFRKALVINSSSDKTLNNLGIALVETGEIEQGLKSILLATNINPINAFAWYNYGAVLHNTTQYVQALEAFERYLSLRPDDHQTWFLCSRLMRRSSTSNEKKARDFLLTAIERDPQNGEYLEEFVKYVPRMNDPTDLELYRKFYTRLPNIKFGKGQVDRIQSLQRSIAARVSWWSVQLGQYREARRAVSGMRIDQEELSECDKSLIYKLVSMDTVDPKFKEPFSKKYYSTIFTHFFYRHYRQYSGPLAYPKGDDSDPDVDPNRKYSDPDPHPKRLLNIYEELLRSLPSNSECLIGKGILLVEILDLDGGSLISYGFTQPRLRTKNEKVPDWWLALAEDAESTLHRAYKLSTDPLMKRDVNLCIKKLRDLKALKLQIE